MEATWNTEALETFKGENDDIENLAVSLMSFHQRANLMMLNLVAAVSHPWCSGTPLIQLNPKPDLHILSHCVLLLLTHRHLLISILQGNLNPWCSYWGVMSGSVFSKNHFSHRVPLPSSTHPYATCMSSKYNWCFSSLIHHWSHVMKVLEIPTRTRRAMFLTWWYPTFLS